MRLDFRGPLHRLPGGVSQKERGRKKLRSMGALSGGAGGPLSGVSYMQARKEGPRKAYNAALDELRRVVSHPSPLVATRAA